MVRHTLWCFGNHQSPIGNVGYADVLNSQRVNHFFWQHGLAKKLWIGFLPAADFLLERLAFRKKYDRRRTRAGARASDDFIAHNNFQAQDIRREAG